MDRKPKPNVPGKRTAEQVDKQLERARKVRSLQGHPGWEVLDQILEEAGRNMQNRLLSDDCDYDEIRAIRRVHGWLRTIRQTPNISDDQIEKWEQQVAFLRNQEKMRQELGMGPGPQDKP